MKMQSTLLLEQVLKHHFCHHVAPWGIHADDFQKIQVWKGAFLVHSQVQRHSTVTHSESPSVHPSACNQR